MKFMFALLVAVVALSSQSAWARHSGGIHGGSHLFQEGAGSKSHTQKTPTAS